MGRAVLAVAAILFCFLSLAHAFKNASMRLRCVHACMRAQGEEAAEYDDETETAAGTASSEPPKFKLGLEGLKQLMTMGVVYTLL